MTMRYFSFWQAARLEVCAFLDHVTGSRAARCPPLSSGVASGLRGGPGQVRRRCKYFLALKLTKSGQNILAKYTRELQNPPYSPPCAHRIFPPFALPPTFKPLPKIPFRLATSPLAAATTPSTTPARRPSPRPSQASRAWRRWASREF